MDIRDIFNNLAFKWDEICSHDDFKLRKIIELSTVKNGSKILDVGTGTGVLVSYLLDTFPSSLTAIDISDNMISIAKSKYIGRDVNFVTGDIMDYNEGGFDYVFLYSVYPHFTDKKILFKHLHSIMNIEGKIVIAHSQSKEKINEVHSKSDHFQNHVLQSGTSTSKIMSNYFAIDMIIDNKDMYYVSGIKKASK